jgi:hypothetical protein
MHRSIDIGLGAADFLSQAYAIAYINQRKAGLTEMLHQRDINPGRNGQFLDRLIFCIMFMLF